jgi:hypothetical protein
MTELFKAISGGLARFVFAWMTPSVIALGLFAIYVLPGIEDGSAVRPVLSAGSDSVLTAGILFAFFVLTTSVLFAYASLPIYQVLEGYLIPRPLANRLRRRHLRRFHRLQVIERRFRVTNQLPPGVSTDDFRLNYPRDAASVRPTRLGNALTAMEHWSATRYQLDSQVMWYELQAISNPNVRQDVDQGRAPVDFFISFIAHMALLAVVALPVGLFTSQRSALVVGALAVASLPLSYRLAVRNMVDWSQSVKAMVNVGRAPLALALNLRLPSTLDEEREMWSAHYHVIELANEAHLEAYDSFRLPEPPAPRQPSPFRRILARCFG